MQSIETTGQLKVAAAQRQKHGKYWRNNLNDISEKSLFHTDSITAAGQLNQRFDHELSAETVAKLAKVSGGKAATRHVVVTTALAALLYRYTDREIITLGQPVKSKDSKLTDYIVFKFALAHDISFKQVLGQARDTVLAALEFQDFPLSILPEEMGIVAESGSNPFFDVAIESIDNDDGKITKNFSCRTLFSFVNTGSTIKLCVSYDDGLYQTQSIERIVRHFEILLDSLLEKPNHQLGQASLMSETDTELLKEMNATEYPYRYDVRIETLFSEQVEQSPDNIALIAEDETLTYRALDEQVEHLSQVLKGYGVKPDQFVGVVAERSPQMMVAILAILRAGGAYLPIDPSYPESRIRYVLENSGAQIILTHNNLLTLDVNAFETIDLNRVAELEVTEKNSVTQGDANNLAYAIYTSGSTGKPKGVLIEHHSVINRIAWMQNEYPITSDDVILQKTPISFDVSVWELFWWFFTGAKVCLLAPGGEREPAQLVDTIEKNKVTTMHFVPSMLNAFLDYIESTNVAHRLKSLRKVFTSGEALGLHQVERFKALLNQSNGTRLINLYGPTEATVDVTHFDCTAKKDLDKVTIGFPIENTQIHIVDSQLQPLPIGVPGELCIAGVGLARGYHQLPEMTADRFVVTPQEPEHRWYRTGDLARWLDNGEIEYLGRLDHQVKIRGFRIELSEIETVLRQHDKVNEAIILVKKVAGQDKLVAYVTTNAEIENDLLRQHAASQVPEYMVPEIIIGLDEMPLSPNGKLDRKALPSPEGYIQTTEYVAPRNETELILVSIWQDVLALDKIGVHDNFFAIGGNSIHFVTVLAKARKHEVVFTFQQLFANPTVAGLAYAMANQDGESQRHQFGSFELISELDRVRLPANTDDAYPLSMLQAGLIFQNELTFGTAQYHDIISYTIESSIDLELFKQAAEILVSRNPIFRTSYHLSGYDEYIQIVHDEVDLPLYSHDLRDLSEAEQEVWYQNWLQEEKAYRFEWEKSGLIRLHIHVLQDNMYRYVLSQHNSALDGWSITLVHTQLFRIYYTLVNGKIFDEVLVENHIRNYIGLEGQALKSEQGKAFWLDMLEGATYTQLPKQDNEQAVSELSVLFHEVEISKQLSDNIIALADEFLVPVKIILMATHLKVLSMVSGDTDVMTGYEHSGRPEAEDATKAIGLFLNTVPFRVDVRAESWADLIQKVYESEVELLPHRRYPMAKMKQDIGTQKLLFDTAFNYTHFYLLKELKDMPEFDLLDIRANSETEFAIRAEFCRHFFTDEVKLSLHYHEHAFTAEQIENMANYYVKVFEMMTSTPHNHPTADVLLNSHEIEFMNEQCQQLPAHLKEHCDLQSGDKGICILDEMHQFLPVGVYGDIYVLNESAQPVALLNSALKTRGLRSTHLKGRWSHNRQLEIVDKVEKLIFSQSTPEVAKESKSGALEELDVVESKIASAWAEALKIPVEVIGKHNNFFDLGGNSLAAMKVTVILDGLVSLVELMRNSTLAPLASVVRDKFSDEASNVLYPLTDNGDSATTAIVCFPYAGGNAINFQSFAQSIEAAHPHIQVFAVEVPGHDLSQANESLITINELAKKVSQEITEQIKVPVMLWGHCIGSAAAHATAKLLEQKNIQVEHIFVGGKLLPEACRSRQLVKELDAMSEQQVKRWLITQTGYGELDSLSSSQMSRLVKVFRHDAREANSYLAEVADKAETLSVPVTVVAASDDPLTENFADSYQNWRWASESVYLAQLELGGHYFCRTEPNKTVVAIDRWLSQ